jgi:hypothetical protein
MGFPPLVWSTKSPEKERIEKFYCHIILNQGQKHLFSDITIQTLYLYCFLSRRSLPVSFVGGLIAARSWSVVSSSLREEGRGGRIQDALITILMLG